MPSGGWETLYEFSGAGDIGASWNERPVDLVVLPNGVVLVTSDDDADRIVAIGFSGL
jgi:glucose/arabinose dehydrogenase